MPPCLLLDGDEEYVKDSAISQLRQTLLQEGMEALNESVLDEKASARQIIEACETLPFMTEKRLVLVKDSPFVLSGKKNQETKDAAGEEAMLDYIATLPSQTQLVFVAKGTADMRKKLPKKIATLGGNVRFDYLKEKELSQWVQRTLRARQKNMDIDAIHELIYRAGPTLNNLESELGKVLDYVGERLSVVWADVDALVQLSAENTTFEMLDHLLKGESEASLQMLARLRLQGGSAVGVIVLMAGQVRRLLHMRAILDGGGTKEQAGSALGLSPYVTNIVFRGVGAYRQERLRSMLQACIEADFAVKSGEMGDELALDGLVLRFLNHC